MEAQQGSTDDTAPEQPAARGDHQEVPPRAGWEDDKARIGRGLAFFCLIGSLTGLTLGVAFYGRYAPRVDILTVELAGAGAPPMTRSRRSGSTSASSSVTACSLRWRWCSLLGSSGPAPRERSPGRDGA